MAIRAKPHQHRQSLGATAAPDLNRRTVLLASAALAGSAAAPFDAAQAATQSPRRTIAFDAGWRFWPGEAAGGELPDLDADAWTPVQLPHDWSIEDLPEAPKISASRVPPAATWSTGRLRGVRTPDGPFGARHPAAPSPEGPPLRVGPSDPKASSSGWRTGFTAGGIGWYRKAFVGPDLASGERAEIRFDGVFGDTEVWLNGVRLGANVYGYGSFAFDLTPHPRPARVNVLAVRVDNEGQTARWYSGSGINQHVRLTLTGPALRAWRARGRGLPDGREIGRKRPETVGPPARLRLTAEGDRIAASPGDLAYVLAEILDASGRKVPDAAADLTCAFEGQGRLRATGSANSRARRASAIRAAAPSTAGPWPSSSPPGRPALP